MRISTLQHHTALYSTLQHAHPQHAGHRQKNARSTQMMLANINMLYLGASVLILMDFDYLKRFWTQFEYLIRKPIQRPRGDGVARVHHLGIDFLIW